PRGTMPGPTSRGSKSIGRGRRWRRFRIDRASAIAHDAGLGGAPRQLFPQEVAAPAEARHHGSNGRTDRDGLSQRHLAFGRGTAPDFDASNVVHREAGAVGWWMWALAAGRVRRDSCGRLG